MVVVCFRKWFREAGSFKQFPYITFESGWFDRIQGMFKVTEMPPFHRNELFFSFKASCVFSCLCIQFAAEDRLAAVFVVGFSLAGIFSFLRLVQH